jgi:tetratricopeptide (TPR) repeat protein
MKSSWSSLLQLPSQMIETGFSTMNAALETMQVVVETVTNQKRPGLLKAPPLDGPRDLDTAVAEFANRLATIVRFTSLDPAELGTVSQGIMEAARRCFGYLDLRDPRNVAFPVQLALSVGTLMTQQGMRGLASYEVVGMRRFPKFVADVFEMFTDVQIFVGLEYRDLIKKLEDRLERAPNDDAARLELGVTLLKCGLYEDATRHLLEASKSPSQRPRALHEAAVALHRGGKFESAARTGSEALIADPNNERALAWLWLTAQKMGGYPSFIPAEHRMELKVGYEKPTVEFEDVAARIGLDKTSAGRGLAVFDYNNDGLLDVVISAAHGGVNLFRNNGDGTFTDVSVGSGLDACLNAFAITVGDYNNDGYPDLFITRLGFYVGEAVLFRNNGDGTFTDVTQQAGLKIWGPAFTAAWVDYDCDGRLDLFVANNLGGLFDRKTPNRLFHNNGDGTFTEVTEAAGLSTIWPTIGAAWGDYNNDGYPDLFLSNAMGRSQLFRNNGDGTFTDVSAAAGVAELCIGAATFWCDYNNDGWLDIIQWAWSDHEDVIHTMRHGEGPPDGQPHRIYQNNGDGTFTLRNRDIGLTGCWGSMSGNAGDFNNDGYLDLVLGNGSPRMDRLEPPILLQNDGARFHNITFAAGLPFYGKGHGATLADLFGDGRLSVLLASGGAYPGDLLTMRVFCPKSLPGNYLNVRLVGVKSNRSAIGAWVSLEAGGGRQYREVSGGSNFGCLPFEQHFGLADIEAVDSVEIRWPSGLRQRFADLPVNKTIQLTEGQTSWVDPYSEAPIHGTGATLRVELEALVPE